MAEDGGALPPGATIGILGGGQLGRMLSLAAAELGLKTHIFCPDRESPAFDVAAHTTIAAYDDAAALALFAGAVDVVTYEFENIDVAAAELLEKTCPVRPGPKALAVSQDRLKEKNFLREAGVAVGAYRAAASEEELADALAEIGAPAILKTRRFGYDGKGQARIGAPDEAAAAFESIGRAPAILEALVPFTREVSVIGVRSVTGEVAAYDVTENVHRNHILHTSTVPAQIQPATVEKAREIAARILSALDYVGVIGVELFVVGEGEAETLLVNEIAPRVHNSGHWTQDGCSVSQFQNHIRAVAGWPLGATERHSNAVMTNLIGAEAEAWQGLAAEPGAALHLYGKREVRPGRKMGHVTRLRPRAPAA
ncbi:5-(carboxyamino)imidazole ribonucleotide synthase [Afifella sp. IM 167]|uniref:5-(carboxyamino)imidazole ribonucleotide synthase n=1 Tax=Afifella sp. IM 167 TaxID=2033586 RepID=UPI001CCB4602|nr:5-(carboxyamino)imidazole ribonucleotide synthase [Afifella sp. IM 167]MBZ8133083.1 5-(carboxyamino)imidazole ribonucleotide synthase [Afifella sp. IM 167]